MDTRELIRVSLAKRRWAVVGATDEKSKFGYIITRTLADAKYEVYPVSPRVSQIDELKAYPSLKDLPIVPEVVDMVVNPRVGIKIMEEIAELGIPIVWLQPGTRSDEIREFARTHGIQLVEDCVLVQLR